MPVYVNMVLLVKHIVEGMVNVAIGNTNTRLEHFRPRAIWHKQSCCINRISLIISDLEVHKYPVSILSDPYSRKYTCKIQSKLKVRLITHKPHLTITDYQAQASISYIIVST